MTVIVGTISDISGNPVEGTLSVRPVVHIGDGTQVVSTDSSEFPIVDGAISANVAPGLAQFTLSCGPSLRVWISNIPDSETVGLGTLLESV